ncbi:hypothetical protein N0V93_008888 [Gnomoniopsis smithogilvyi]|uniref:Helicase n=1 Tax=Gnomoniopsis smithogilvyi TaxID=1191159 RepID=A0A9W8YIY0_9PEZI|nr:hypothetical protein N0V93_008888 [Gnomoniopsis smithogilvyi]
MSSNTSAAAAIIRSHIQFDPAKARKDDYTNKDTLSDWERLPELPSSEEILSDDASDDLPWFPTNHVWKNKPEYLEALYKILRFEGVEGLRYSVRNVRNNPNIGEDDNTCIYTKVYVKGYLFAKLGPIARISFSTIRAGVKIKWMLSKRLQPGKVVALSADFFKTDCRIAVVAQRPFDGGLDQNPPIIDIIWADGNQAIVNPEQELVMIEARNGYYEAVRHALRGLQHAAQEWSPFDKYVVTLDRSDLPCSSVTKNVKLSILVDHLTRDHSCNSSMNGHDASRRTENGFFNDFEVDLECLTGMDDSQVQALQRILTKEIAIIQGPPGTGKTFTSVKSIMAILKYRRAGDPPIIISAQTNHALDQLLIHCKSAGANIMRVGGRTDNDEIAQRTMYELRQAFKLGGQGKYLEKQRLLIAERFEALVHNVFGGTGLLDPKALYEAGVLSEAQYRSLSDEDWEESNDDAAMDSWLGNERIERIRQMDDLDFEEFEALDVLDENLNDEKVDTEDDPIRGRFVTLSSQHTGQRPHASSWEARCRALLEKHSDLYDIPRGYRGGVYQVLELKLRKATEAKFRRILEDAVEQAQEGKARGWIRDLRVVDRHCIDIVGCTTTGLTKYRGFLSAIQPKVLLIEEAAETREANIASALFPSLQQLILVGDHQQLPPSCDIARLAKDPYNLNVSLFERLVDVLPYTMLNCQRRMAPELRAIVQKFYPKLKDHPLVRDTEKRPLIPGMGERRSWFFTHQWPDDTDADNSKFNQAEVDMVVSFVCYLIQNGVSASEITILTYYKGQKRKLLKCLRQRYPTGKFFNVATVDSYQGEENEIVILSLVRSPGPSRDYRVGFLDSRNRATVAISRARRGFFMFGNKDNLLNATVDSFKTWAPIWNAFAEQRRVAMSKGLPLVCRNHGNEIWVKEADELVGNAGGCWVACHGHLKCGHACSQMCHITSHELVSCSEPCARALDCGHKCAGYCTDPCQCAVNCPEYAEIRLRDQLAAQAHIHESEVSNTWTSSSPARLAGMSSASPASAYWQNMVDNPVAYDRNERAKAMGDVKLTMDTFKRAFGGIKETYVAISEQDGRRVQGVPTNAEVREEAPLRRMKTDTSRSNGSGVARTRRPVNKPWENGKACLQVSNSNDSISDSHTAKGHGGKDLGRQSQHPNVTLVGRRQGSSMKETSCPEPIDTFIAIANNVTVRARCRPHGNNPTNGRHIGVHHTTRPWIEHAGGSPAKLSPTLQQDDIPDSASVVGGLGFNEELSQAIRRAGQLQTAKVRHAPSNAGRFQLPGHDSIRGEESLIDFADNGTTSTSGKPQDGQDCQSQKYESLIDLELDQAFSLASLDEKFAKDVLLLDDM